MSRRLSSTLRKSKDFFDSIKSPQTSKQRPYAYSPLRASSKKIRLLTLLPGAFGTDIHCDLCEEKLQRDSPPRYQALSYTWGSEPDPLLIYIGKGTLPVTQNLAGALQHLRYPARPRTLWIDAVCVNQQDLDERSEQVPRMADIYALAESVVVWLGPEADESSFALRTLDTLGSMVDTNWSAFTMKPSHEASAAGQLHWADWTVKMPFKSRELDPIHHLLERPWFERLWIQQEIALATEAILISGFESIAWSRFRNAIFCLYIKVREQKQVVSKFGIFWDRITLIHNFCEESHGYTMVQQLIRTNYCKCADPRDRIFALLSISKLPIGVEIKADYRKSTEELYQEVALEYYKRYLYMLTFCELQNSRAGKPTWVPNWATRRLTCDLPTARAGGNSNPLVQYMGGNVLRVIGIRVARINSADPVRVPGMLYKEAVAAIQRHAPPPSDLKSSLDIYCRTLHCDLFGNWHDPPIARHENFEECREALRSLLDIDRAPTSTVQKRAFINAAITYIMHRSIFWTDDGRMGLGPGLAQATDEIVVFPGCPAPMMLRPSSNGRYQVIGECFIHDLMDSEALLGPRPEHYQQRVRKLPEGAQMYYEAYRDNQTGQIQDEDPRLGSLPSRLRDDGVRQIYPTGLPRGGEERDYMGWLTWTKRWVGDGDMVEVMRNDLRPFLLE